MKELMVRIVPRIRSHGSDLFRISKKKNNKTNIPVRFVFLFNTSSTIAPTHHCKVHHCPPLVITITVPVQHCPHISNNSQ
ncbi:unnamed protein product [Staurois parvus]|uniref:Uncharacterized protein n=1 Tax=Staurois parvus TaxID=386267 RepID=A0ABN9BBX8_9NEOB|nr:unnamed protein product [Staurois parvus]